MFKTSANNKHLSQQRAVLKPIKSTSLYEEEEEEDVEDQESFLDDDSSFSSNNNGAALTSDTRNDTMLLAQFLATTGPPEEYGKTDDSKKKQQFNRASRLLKRLRKKPTMTALRNEPIPETTNNERRTHIPLSTYETIKEDTNQQRTTVSKDNSDKGNFRVSTSSSYKVNKQQSSASRDSGVYSETNSERESCLSSLSGNYEAVPPLPPFTSMLSDIQFPHPPKSNQPRRPLPPSIAAIMNTTENVRAVPEAALKRRSVRLRHVQVQTTEAPSSEFLREKPMAEDKQACPHCRQIITASSDKSRRTSCPPALASGLPLLPANDLEDSKVLLAMIMKLKSQLEEEKMCRLKLERAMQQQKRSDERRELLAREKDKWADNCVWLDDRLAFLPE